MRSVLAASVAVIASASVEMESLFESWRVNNGVQFSSTSEYVRRLDIFQDNHRRIEKHNAGNSTFTMAHNQFSHLSSDEFKSMYTGGFNGDSRMGSAFDLDVSVAIPTEVDWTAAGAVSAVKDQGQCGSCWAFSTTGGVEGAVFLKTGKLTSLSEQQLVDCAGSTGNKGCNGGLMDDAFQYIIQNGGIGSESSYPYTAADGSCKKVASVSTISSFTDVNSGSESALLSAVNNAPISIAIEADQSGFQFYQSGVFKGPCGKQLDHGVLLVGYGTDASGGDYWRVKNSWGSSWGDAGYIRIARGSDLCGIADAASFPVA
jgi:C1A family cysteine protease